MSTQAVETVCKLARDGLRARGAVEIHCHHCGCDDAGDVVGKIAGAIYYVVVGGQSFSPPIPFRSDADVQRWWKAAEELRDAMKAANFPEEPCPHLDTRYEFLRRAVARLRTMPS